MDRISDFAVLLAVIEKGSLTRAARELGRSLQSVSRALALLERDVGVELVHRTTRSCSATEAGLDFYRRVKLALSEIEEAKQDASRRRVEASGLLTIACPGGFAHRFVVPAAAAFLEANPQVRIELNTFDRFSDIAKDGVDLTIQIGALEDSAVKSRRIARMRRAFCAAPAYLQKHGRPRKPEDLLQHQCIIRTARDGGEVWPFLVQGKIVTLQVAGNFRASGSSVISEAAARGLGIAIAPLAQVRPLLDAGLVELVLERYVPPPIPVFATWSASKLLPAKTRRFIDFLAARLSEQQL